MVLSSYEHMTLWMTLYSHFHVLEFAKVSPTQLHCLFYVSRIIYTCLKLTGFAKRSLKYIIINIAKSYFEILTTE